WSPFACAPARGGSRSARGTARSAPRSRSRRYPSRGTARARRARAAGRARARGVGAGRADGSAARGWTLGMTRERMARLTAGALLAVQAALALLNVGGPRWRAVDLDQEHNLATWFQASLLALVALLALRALVIEVRTLGRAGLGRAGAAAWLVVAAAFAYLAADEALVIHEGLLTAELEARLGPGSPLRLTLTWLLVFLPAIVGGVAFLLAAFAARARLYPRLLLWGAAGLVA